MRKKPIRVVHLFEDDNFKDEDNLSPRRMLRTHFGVPTLFSTAYYGKKRTLCGRRSTFLIAFTIESLKEVPLEEGERFCRHCARTKDGALRLLSII